MVISSISSRQNPIIKEVVKLKSSAARRECGLHIAEGERLLHEAAAHGLEALFALEAFIEKHPWAEESAKQTFIVTEPVLEALCDTKNAAGRARHGQNAADGRTRNVSRRAWRRV